MSKKFSYILYTFADGVCCWTSKSRDILLIALTLLSKILPVTSPPNHGFSYIVVENPQMFRWMLLSDKTFCFQTINCIEEIHLAVFQKLMWTPLCYIYLHIITIYYLVQGGYVGQGGQVGLGVLSDHRSDTMGNHQGWAEILESALLAYCLIEISGFS